MKRRSFFKSLSAAVVGCYLALGTKLPSIAVDEETIAVNTYHVHWWLDDYNWEKIGTRPMTEDQLFDAIGECWGGHGGTIEVRYPDGKIAKWNNP